MIAKINQNNNRLPDFFVIGAAKSGTSTLFKYLTRHEEVFIPAVKEIEFFCKDTNFNKGLSWYTAHFSESGENQKCGDSSTTYSRWPHSSDVPSRIKEILDKPKFIYIMRHPVERTFSHYVHHMRKGVTMSFEEALEHNDIYIDCSKYMMQIERYLRFFSKDSFLFLTLDELKQNPSNVICKIQDFLDIGELEYIPEKPIVRNKSTNEHFLRAQTTGRLLNIKGFNKLKEKLPQSWKDLGFKIIKASPIGTKLSDSYNIPPLQTSTRAKLLKEFYTDTKKLERFLGKDLERWFV